jgi:hypothetical protein
MIVWHVETSSGARFEWARDAEHQRQQMIDYFNECLADGEAEHLPDDTEFEEVKDAIEEHENFSEEEVYGGYLIEGRERDTILAALRLYQSVSEGRTEIMGAGTGPSPTLADLQEIANNDHDEPLTAEEVDALCERLNS